MADGDTVPVLPAAVRVRRDDILERFEAAWEAGDRPAVENFLPDESDLRRAVVARLAAIDLERRLKAGEKGGVADYRARPWFAELGGADVASLLFVELEFRTYDSPAEREALLAQFPDQRAEVEDRVLRATTRELPRPQTPDLPNPFGRYRIVRRLGRGNMGVVYLAHDPRLDRYVALKTPLERTGPLADRHTREALAAARLHHSNLCLVYEADEIDGVPYLTMAYVAGARSLTQAYPPPLPPRQAAELTRRLALAVAEAHRNGVIHRDLKPDNILVGDRGEPVVTDFGLARRSAPGDGEGTAPGVILGTAAYMPPEQAGGDPAAHGPAGDVYSLGVILYELLSGRPPFRGSFQAVIHQVITVEPPPPAAGRTEGDPALAQICLKAMAKRPEARFPDMTAFADALKAWLDGPPPPAAPAAPPPSPDPRASEEAHRLLREWGWEEGVGKLREAAAAAPDEGRRAPLRVALGWLACERGRYAEARDAFGASGLAGWALAGQALAEMREKRHGEAEKLLKEAAGAAGADAVLRATVAHLQGTLDYHRGRCAAALALLHEALEAFGPAHFGAGRVLDTLGMVHAGRDNFPAACEFYAESLRLKQDFGDDAGVAVTNGQLGRLHLDWGALDRADQYFQAGADRARWIGDARGEAQLLNHRGQVWLARGQPTRALPFFDESLRESGGRYLAIEAFARKDRALARLALGQMEAAREDCDAAEQLFQSASFAEGVFHARRARGLVCLARGRGDEAAQLLRAAAAYFESAGEWAEAARARRDLARALRAADPDAARREFTAAAACARRARRRRLAEAFEWERGVPPERESGPVPRGAVDPDENIGGVEGTATVLAVELRRDDEAEAPGALRQTRAHLLLDLALALADAEAVVDHHTEGGWVALAAGHGHGRRAAAAAAAVARAVAEHNRPRRVLGKPLWRVYAALDAGVVFRGDAVAGAPGASGAAVLRAVRLLAEAEAGRPCLTEAVWDLAGDLRGDGPRAARCAPRVWDMVP